MFPFECFAIIGSLPENVYNKVIWLTKHFYENHFVHFLGDVRKTTVVRVLEIIGKTSSVAFSLKNLSFPIYPPITPPQNLTPPQVFLLYAPGIFQIAARASVVQSLSIKVTVFCDSVKKSNTCMVWSEN